jgi:hypothetical protein
MQNIWRQRKNVSGRFGARPETLTDEVKPELFLPYPGTDP